MSTRVGTERVHVMVTRLVTAVVLAVGLVACSGDDETTRTGTSAERSARTERDAPATSPSAAGEPSPSEAPTATGPTGEALPGEPFSVAPEPGTELGVVGVRFDDVLNVRRVPGADAKVVAAARSTASGLVATGRARMLTGSIWTEVTVRGVTGWVNSAFVADTGAGIGITSDVVQQLGGRPTADTMLALGRMVARTRASDSEPKSTLTVAAAPTSGDRGAVTYDVIGLGDDAVLGERLRITAQRVPDGYRLKDVEATLICARHADEETGLCV